MKRVVYSTLILFVAAVLLQGFQCASREMNTAKMDYQKGKYEDAIENIKKELKKNPKNEEAHMLYVDILMKQGDYKSAASVLYEARDYIKSKKNIEKASMLENQILVGAYNTAYQSYQRYFKNKEDKLLDTALMAADLCLTLRPELLDLYNLQGRIYEIRQDKAKTIEAYEKYVKANMDEYNLAKETGINLDMFREEALAILGKPVDSVTRTIDSTKGSGTISDKIEYEGKEIYLHSKKGSTADSYKVEGWRLNLPKNWSKGDKFQYNPINTDPYAALAQIYYDGKKYDDAIRNLDYLLAFNPSNKEAGSLKIQLLQETGNTDKAIAELEVATKENPDNKRYWLQFGDLLSSMNKFDEAVEKYQKALEIDPNYDYALYNIASAYKNIAGSKQKIEQEKLDKNPDYKVNTDLYFPDLKKSAEYYSKTVETKQFKDNYSVLLQLANIYQVMEDEPNLKKTLSRLDQVEYNVPQNEKRSFYLDLLKIYSTMKDEAKTQQIQQKLQKLK